MKFISIINTLSISWNQKSKLTIKPAYFCLFAIVLSLTFLTNACGFGFNQSRPPLRIGTITFPGYDIARYAQTSEIFKQRGLKVEFVLFDNSQDTNRAVMRGSLDATFTTLWEVMQVDPGDGNPAVLMAIDISAGADGIFAKPEIKSVVDLRGKKVGAKLGTISHLTLLEALTTNQMKPSDVQILDYLNEVAAQKIKTGEIDAAVLWEPVLRETAKSVKGNIIHTTKQVDSLAIDILMSSNKIVKAKRSELKQFMLAWFDVMHAVETEPKKVFKAVGEQLGQSAESFASDYAGLKKGDMTLNRRMFGPESRLKSAKVEIVQLLKSDPRHNRIIRQDVETDPTLLNEVMAEWKP